MISERIYKLGRICFLRTYSLWIKSRLKKSGSKNLFYFPLFLENPMCICIGKNCKIGSYCRIGAFPDYAGSMDTAELIIGSNVCIERHVDIYCSRRLVIGNNVLVASGCLITDNNHGIMPSSKPYVSQPLQAKETIIEDNVWLGEHVCVLSGACIGERSIIGCNSVVTGCIPPFSIAVGAPARVIKRYNFSTNAWERV